MAKESYQLSTPLENTQQEMNLPETIETDDLDLEAATDSADDDEDEIEESALSPITMESTQSEKNMALMKAIKTGDLTLINQAIDLRAATDFIVYLEDNEDEDEYEAYKQFDDEVNFITLTISPFIYAAALGYTTILNLLLDRTPEDKHDKMIHADDDAAFILAAYYGQEHILKMLIGLTKDPVKLEKMIHAYDDAAFIEGINSEEPERILKLLLDHTPNRDKQLKMVLSWNVSPLTNNIHNLRPHIIKFLLGIIDDPAVGEQITHIKNQAFGDKDPNTDTLKLLLDLTPDPIKRLQMIHSNDDKAFKDAVSTEAGTENTFLVKLLFAAGIIDDEFSKKLEDNENIVKLLLDAGVIDNNFSKKINEIETKSNLNSYTKNPIGSFIDNNDDPYLIDLAINSYKESQLQNYKYGLIY